MSPPPRVVAAAAGVVAGLTLLAAPSTVHADAAGPTDYRSEVVAVEPPTDVIDVTIEGGDAFVRVAVEPGHEVVVLGYPPDREPYLRIRADGAVERNVRSYATYYNDDRFGRTTIPDVVDTTAPPDWERIGTGGAWSWHDHRAHWMGDDPPFGLDPGEALPDQTIDLLVDGAPVGVTVRTTLQAAPNPSAAVAGFVLGLVLGLAALWLGPATGTLVLLLAGVGALVVGGGQFLSLSAATGPLVTWWLLPALAVVGAAAAIATFGRSAWTQLGLIGVGAGLLMVWAATRLRVLTAAVLPTDLPFWLDRGVTAATLVASIGVLAAVARAAWSTSPPAA